MIDIHLPIDQKVSKTVFGAIVEDLTWNEGSYETTVTFPTLPFSKDLNQQADFLDRMAAGLYANDQPIYTCGDRNLNPVDPSFFFDFMPVYVTSLTPKAATYSYTGSACFETLDFIFAVTSETSYEVTLNLGKKSNLACHEYILFGDTEALHMQVFYRSGTHVLKFNMPTYDEQRDLSMTGLRVWKTCDGMPHALESILRTVTLLSEEKAFSFINQQMWEAAMRFAAKAMNAQFIERQNQSILWLDESTIHSGDILGSYRPDGLTSIISYGTGAAFSHILEFLWFEDGLYVVESTAPVVKRTAWRELIQERFD